MLVLLIRRCGDTLKVGVFREVGIEKVILLQTSSPRPVKVKGVGCDTMHRFWPHAQHTFSRGGVYGACRWP